MGERRSNRRTAGKRIRPGVKAPSADDRIRSLCHEILESWVGPESDLPQELFHYTRFKSGKSILESGKLRLFEVLGMHKDPTEVLHACDVVRRIVEANRRVPEHFRDYFRRDPRHGLGDGWNAFAFCFCGDRESPFHWGEYGDRGCGMAIGFACDKLRALGQSPDDPQQQFHLMPMQYSDGQLEDAVRRIKQRAVELDPRGQLPCRFWIGTAFALLECSLWFKKPSYKDDREWRMQAVRPRDACSCESQGDRRYIERPFPMSVLSRVVLGPMTGSEEQAEMRAFLDRAGYCEVPVQSSRLDRMATLGAEELENPKAMLERM